MTEDEMASFLIADGWREFPDHFRKWARSFYKRFDTPTRCACNDDKAGMQVCVALSNFDNHASYQIDMCGELPSGTWVKLEQWSMPRELADGLKLIPRLLATWEFMAAHPIN